MFIILWSYFFVVSYVREEKYISRQYENINGLFYICGKSRTELNFRFKSHFHEICEIVFDNFSQ